jgi:uncharacterized protein YcbK (DUF882 family)
MSSRFISLFLAAFIALSVGLPLQAEASTVSGSRGLHPRLSHLLRKTAHHFRRHLSVTSGCRSLRHNRRIGGARRSLHVRCMAADIRVTGVSEGTLLRYVRRLPGRGGVGTYCRNSVVHLDIGERREWHQGCGRKRKHARRKR